MKKNRRSLPSSEVPPTVLKSGRRAADQTKINSSDPPLTAVGTADATQPFLPFFHPPIKLAGFRPRGRLYLDRRIDFSAICIGTLL